MGAILATGVVVVVAIAVLMAIWLPNGKRRAIYCPDSQAERAAALNAFSPLPDFTIYNPTHGQITHMRAWADEKQQWLDSQSFSPCVRKAYQGWIDHVRGYRVDQALQEIRKAEAFERVKQRPEFRSKPEPRP